MCPRLTPAYAGNIDYSILVDCHSWDHPRVCGEYPVSSIMLLTVSGSPPHMRGIYCAGCLRFVEQGLTPAYTGNIQRPYKALRPKWAHPRIYGEYFTLTSHHSPWLGSPPHMWGISRCSNPVSTSLRLTPAYAGNIHKVLQ